MQVAALALHCSLLAAEQIRLEIQKFEQIDNFFSMTPLAFSRVSPGLFQGTDKGSRSFKGVVCPSLPAYFFGFVQGFNFTSTLSGGTEEIKKGFLRMNISTGIT